MVDLFRRIKEIHYWKGKTLNLGKFKTSGHRDFINSLTNDIAMNCIMHAKVLQLCVTLCDAMDYSPPVSSVHGLLLARILEWVAISSSTGSSQPGD